MKTKQFVAAALFALNMGGCDNGHGDAIRMDTRHSDAIFAAEESGAADSIAIDIHRREEFTESISQLYGLTFELADTMEYFRPEDLVLRNMLYSDFPEAENLASRDERSWLIRRFEFLGSAVFGASAQGHDMEWIKTRKKWRADFTLQVERLADVFTSLDQGRSVEGEVNNFLVRFNVYRTSIEKANAFMRSARQVDVGPPASENFPSILNQLPLDAPAFVRRKAENIQNMYPFRYEGDWAGPFGWGVCNGDDACSWIAWSSSDGGIVIELSSSLAEEEIMRFNETAGPTLIYFSYVSVPDGESSECSASVQKGGGTELLIGDACMNMGSWIRKYCPSVQYQNGAVGSLCDRKATLDTLLAAVNNVGVVSLTVSGYLQ